MAELGEADVKAAWNASAESWIGQVRAGVDFHREVFNNPLFFAFLPDLAGKEVLDLGCGEGHNTRQLARMGLRLTGIDLTPKFIAAARASEAVEPLGIAYHEGSYNDLADFDDGSFDAALSTMALMDGPDFSRAAQATFRVLRPGGSFTFSVLHPCFTSPGARWLRDGKGREEALALSDYFSAQPFLETWRLSLGAPDAEPFVTPRFVYRLADYINGLAGAGFRIQRMEEARPTAEMVAAHPRLARLRRHRALYLYISSVKD